MLEAYVGIGSNVDPERALRFAIDGLERRFGAVRGSSVYRSAASGVPAPDYLNMAALVSTDLPPGALKQALVALEVAAGRERSAARLANCPLDLDLLLYGRRVDAAARLPHPDVLRRAYVLGPLAELAPRVVHPLTGERLGDAWARSAFGAMLERRGAVGGRG